MVSTKSLSTKAKKSQFRKSQAKKARPSQSGQSKRRLKKRLFSGMGYREVQRSNASRRGQLSKRDRDTLKTQGYKNLGWDNVIRLYQRLNELALQPDPNEASLEDLFLKADRIGRKYQTPEEIEAFDRKLSSEVGAIADIVDQQFPDPETEFIDYSRQQPGTKAVAKRKR